MPEQVSLIYQRFMDKNFVYKLIQIAVPIENLDTITFDNNWCILIKVIKTVSILSAFIIGTF